MIALLLAITPLLASAAAVEPAAIDATVGRLMASEQVPGLGVALIRNGRVTFVKAYGQRNVKQNFTPTTFYRVISGALPPALRIFPGDTVRTETVDAGGIDKNDKPRQMWGNPVTGPFYVEGAMPGDTLAVHINRIRPNRKWASQAARCDSRRCASFRRAAVVRQGLERSLDSRSGEGHGNTGCAERAVEECVDSAGADAGCRRSCAVLGSGVDASRSWALGWQPRLQPVA